MLPIHAVLDALKAALAAADAASCSSRRPAPARPRSCPWRCWTQPWLAGGKILVLEPRRLAARAAADADGHDPGRDRSARPSASASACSRRSRPATRIEVVTEGVFTRMILDDPGLDGVGACSSTSSTSAAWTPTSAWPWRATRQALLREDLRLLVMSATLDGAAVSPPAGRRAGDREPGPGLPGRDPLPRPRRPPAAGGRRSPAPSSGRWPRRPAACWSSCRARARSTARPSGWPSGCATRRRHRAALRRAGPGRAGPRHRARRRRAGARWCWPPRSPRPA